MRLPITRGYAIQNTANIFTARVYDIQTTPRVRLTPDWATAAYYTASVSGTPITGHNQVSLTVADILFEELQTEGGSRTGFNFKATVPPGAFPTEGQLVLVEFDIRPADEDLHPIYIPFECKVVGRVASTA